MWGERAFGGSCLSCCTGLSPGIKLRLSCFAICTLSTEPSDWTHVDIFFLKMYLFIRYKYTVAVFRHTRRGCQIPLQMVVSHHVIAGFELRTFRRAVTALNRWAISPTQETEILVVILVACWSSHWSILPGAVSRTMKTGWHRLCKRCSVGAWEPCPVSRDWLRLRQPHLTPKPMPSGLLMTPHV